MTLRAQVPTINFDAVGNLNNGSNQTYYKDESLHASIWKSRSLVRFSSSDENIRQQKIRAGYLMPSQCLNYSFTDAYLSSIALVLER